ncbi:MAG: sodium:proton antiporter [Oscillospiraceae bacterium]|nr:sodium:proton antiporter [Oscillospiraceae bacterium]
MLFAVFISNMLNRFIPALSAPLIQMTLGVIISLIPYGAFGLDFELNSDLFFVLFISPLIFRAGYIFDKKTLWDMKRPIVGSAVVLVFITVIAGGLFTHYLIPAIPLAACFALIGALGPTDDVAVVAVAKRVAVPNKIMGILGGESIINDASGIVCFQFAIAAVMTGTFSVVNATGKFFIVGAGGVVIGYLMTQLKYSLLKWLHKFGVGNATLLILLDVLTPFVIFIVADNLAVSGILAAFSSGIVHSFMRDKINPETIKLNIAMESVWDFLVFSLEGFVFVMLGAQLPPAMNIINSDFFQKSGVVIIGYVLVLTLMFIVLRFLWWTFTVPKKVYQEENRSEIGRVKSALIFGHAGVRGAVTLACVMSIPSLLNDGTAFPERDLIILIASGVIIVSMLIANFILPLIVGHKSGESQGYEEKAAYYEIIQSVITQLKNEATDENRNATETVIQSYSKRSAVVKSAKTLHDNAQIENDIWKQIVGWEEKNTRKMLEKGVINEITADLFLYMLSKRADIKKRVHFFRWFSWYLRYIKKNKVKGKVIPRRAEIAKIRISNSRYVVKKLNEIQNEENAVVVEILIAEFGVMSERRRRQARNIVTLDDAEAVAMYNVAVRGFYIERKLIHELFEANRISRETAKEMRLAILASETQLHNDFR